MTFESSVFFAVFYSANFGKDSDSWQLKSRESYFKWKLSHVILCAVLFYQYEENEKKEREMLRCNLEIQGGILVQRLLMKSTIANAESF